MTAQLLDHTHRPTTHGQGVGTGTQAYCTATGCRGGFSFAWRWPAGTPEWTATGEHTEETS